MVDTNIRSQERRNRERRECVEQVGVDAGYLSDVPQMLAVLNKRLGKESIGLQAAIGRGGHNGVDTAAGLVVTVLRDYVHQAAEEIRGVVHIDEGRLLVEQGNAFAYLARYPLVRERESRHPRLARSREALPSKSALERDDGGKLRTSLLEALQSAV